MTSLPGTSPDLSVPPFEDRYFDSAGVKIRYVEAGSGAPLILAHGFLTTVETQWIERGLFAELCRTHRVIAFDQRGHGKSGKPHRREQYGPEMGHDIVRLMDHLGLPRAHVMGYSLGAAVSAQLVLEAPQRLLTLILGGSAGRFDWTPDDQDRVEIEAGELEQGFNTTQVMRLWPKGRPRPSIEEARVISAKRLAGEDTKALAAIRRSNVDQVIRLADMGAVKVPLLGIVGTADPNQQQFEKLKSVLPQMPLVLIEGASHMNAPGRPEFVQAVKEFLALHD